MVTKQHVKFRVLQGTEWTDRGEIPIVIWQGNDLRDFKPPLRPLTKAKLPPLIVEEYTESSGWIKREWDGFEESNREPNIAHPTYLKR